MINYYELLEINKNASNEVVSKIFKHHIKKNHPDLFSGKEKQDAELKVKKLNEAYEVLSNPEKRKIYDEELEIYENQKFNDKDIIIENLQTENKNLKHSISNYNRFIYEYFYEKADDVIDVINSYNYENIDDNTLQNVNSSFKSTIKKYLYTVLVYLVGLIIFFIIISIMFRINLFSIFFNTFFN